MFGFRFPQWFVDKYPAKIAALKLNAQERLVTPFDIHATFHHLLDIDILIVAKASDGQRYPLPLSLCLVVCDGERGSGPEGADDVYF